MPLPGDHSVSWITLLPENEDQRDLLALRTTPAKALAALQVEQAGIEGQRKVAEADLGPVKYLATLVGAKDDDVLRDFFLVVAMLVDRGRGAAVLAARSARRTRTLPTRNTWCEGNHAANATNGTSRT